MNETGSWRLPAGVEQWLAPLLRGSKRKWVVYLCGIAMFGLAILVLTRPAATPAPAVSAPRTPAADETETAQGDGDRLARELAGILGRIAGAGKVEVRLALVSSTASTWEQNQRLTRRTVEDRAQDGGVQVTSEETEETTLALVRRPDGSEAPVEREKTAAEVAGAIIVADGARDPRVRTELARAGAAFLRIGLHRVMVFPREEGL